MLKKITVEEAVMLVMKKETDKLYVERVGFGDARRSFAHFVDTNIMLQRVRFQKFWLMTDDE